MDEKKELSRIIRRTEDILNSIEIATAIDARFHGVRLEDYVEAMTKLFTSKAAKMRAQMEEAVASHPEIKK